MRPNWRRKKEALRVLTGRKRNPERARIEIQKRSSDMREEREGEKEREGGASRGTAVLLNPRRSRRAPHPPLLPARPPRPPPPSLYTRSIHTVLPPLGHFFLSLQQLRNAARLGYMLVIYWKIGLPRPPRPPCRSRCGRKRGVLLIPHSLSSFVLSHVTLSSSVDKGGLR